MLDIKRIREAPDEVERLLKTKDPSLSVKEIVENDKKLRHLKGELETLLAEKNRLAKAVGEASRQKKGTRDLLKRAQGLGTQIGALEKEYHAQEALLHHALASLPNLPFESIPISPDPKDNVCIKSFGTKSTFPFPPKHHLELAEKNHLLDFKRGAKLSGSGWPLYTALGARLEWALLKYMIDVHLERGFEMLWLPFLVRPEIMYGVGQLPKFEKQLFKVKDDDYELYLIPTAEAAIGGIYYDEILPKEALPKKYIAYTPCFRREAGAHGESERGLIRVHQFNKVEMFAYTTPETSDAMFDTLLQGAEAVLEGLGLHYRCMQLVTGDMSFAAAKTVDVEVFLPGQNRYYEVSSVSNCTDFQARRAKIRYRPDPAQKPEYLHTLNGSGVATARLFVALLENNQKEDGTFDIPFVLKKYL